MAYRKDNNFRFVGKGASYLNIKECKERVKNTCDYAGVKIINEGDGFGRSQNVVIMKNAKADKYGRYDENDILGRFNDGDKCNAFINGMYAATRMQRLKKRK